MRSHIVLRSTFAIWAVLSFAACDDGSRAVPYTEVEFGPPVVVPTQDNRNNTQPTLTTYVNAEVPPGAAEDTLTLVWSDEFDGTQLNNRNWFFETGDGSQYGIPGWGNNELQYYLPDSAQLEDGLLKITAREESIGAFRYTSARINTRDRFAFQYGRIEARMRLPGGQGIWPAFWMLAQDSPYGIWPASGEIDIMEATNLGVGGKNEVLGTIHFGTSFPSDYQFSSTSYVVPANAQDEFHTYAVEWDADEIRWYVDGVMYAMRNSWYSTAPFPAPFNHPFYIIFNVAVGGNLPGAPDASTVFPVTMEVDWVRVYSGDP